MKLIEKYKYFFFHEEHGKKGKIYILEPWKYMLKAKIRSRFQSSKSLNSEYCSPPLNNNNFIIYIAQNT